MDSVAPNLSLDVPGEPSDRPHTEAHSPRRFSPRWVSLLTLLLLLPTVSYYAAQPEGAIAALRAFVLVIGLIWGFELTTQRDWFRPRILVLSILSLYALPLPALLVFTPNVPVMASPAQVADSCVVVLFAYLGLMVGDLLPLPRTVRALVQRVSVRDRTIRAVFVLFVIIVLPIFLWEFHMLRQTGFFGLTRAERVGYGSIHGAGLFFPAYSALSLMCLVAIAPVFSATHSRLYLRARCLLIATVSLLGVVGVGWLESRYLIAVLLIGSLVTIHKRFRKIPRPTIAMIAVAMIAMLMLMALVRVDYRVSQMAAMEMFHPLRHGELRELHESIIYTDAYIESRSPLYGQTYLNAYRVILPRFLVQRPAELAAEDAKDMIRTDPTLWYSAQKSFDRFARGHHFGYSSTAEAYLNFGLVGPFIVFLLFIVCLRTLHDGISQNSGLIGFYAVLASSSFWFIRSPVAYFVKDMLMFFLLPFCILAIGLSLMRPWLRADP